MINLVADVGGTNTRIALARDDGQVSAIERFSNDRFASFPDILRHYLHTRDIRAIDACCIAIAGPVACDHARLTNRDWPIDRAEIAAAIPGPLARPVRLLNDLAALGYALGGLGADSLRSIHAPDATGPGNDQALVAGLGTGFNVCAVQGCRSPTVFAAEMGHGSLPTTVSETLRTEIGDAAAGFARNEDLFCGPGLSRLHQVVSGESALPAPEVMARADAGDVDAVRTVDLAARLLGLMARQLVPAYMPLSGLYLAGSVARALLGAAERGFVDSFAQPGPFSEMITRVPVRLIADDAAALTGAARAVAT